MFKGVTPDQLNISSPNSAPFQDRIALFVYREVQTIPRQTQTQIWSPFHQMIGRGAIPATASLRDTV